MAESIYRKGGKGFTTVYRSVAQDKRLSLKARGLFLLIQSLPDDWRYTIDGLAGMSGVGVRQIRGALRELEEVGYLVREQSHADGGEFAGNVWVLQQEAPSETPEPLCQNVTTVEAQNPPLLRNALTRNALTRNDTLQNTIVTNNTPQAPTGGGVCEPVSGADDGAKDGAKSDAKRGSAPKWKPDRFEKFWEFYRAHGRGEARQKAVSAWDRLKPDDDLIALMGQALLRQTASETWRRGVGIPYASSWLNGRRWEDELPVTTPPDGPPPENEMEVFGWQP